MKPRRARIIDRQWTAWNDRMDTEERHSRWFWPLVVLWTLAVVGACWSAWFYFIPWLMEFR